MRSLNWQDARKILCVRLDNLGDVLMTTPAFRALKSLNPHVSLTLLTSDKGAEVAQFISEIDSVIEFAAPWVKLDDATANNDAIPELVSRLEAENFDAAVIFTTFSQDPLPAALVCYLAHIPLRLASCRDNPYGLLTDWVPDHEPFSPVAHEVTRQLRLVESIDATTDDTRLSLRVSPVLRNQALAKLKSAGVDTHRPWIILHPGVSEKKRQYPPQAYAQACNELSRQGVQIVITGVNAERELADQLAWAVEDGVSLASQLSLGEFIGLVDAAPLLLSNNTGPVHIAAAVGTPVVVLYAATNPQHTPWQVPNHVLYFDVPAHLRSKNPLLGYTYQHMMQPLVSDIQPKDVVWAVNDMLSKHANGQQHSASLSAVK